MRCRSSILVLALASVAGCGGDDGPPAAPVLEGGSYQFEGCDEVVTPLYAEAPALGEDVLGADPAPFQVRLGLGGDPTTSMAMLWRTDEATTATTVRFGASGGALDQTLAGVTFRYADGIDGVGSMIRMHEVHLCGLDPDTAYDYQVGGVGEDGTESFSETHTFRTAPDLAATPDAEVVIAFIGDSRGGYSVWRQIVDEVAEHAPDLVIFTGDTVTIGQSQEEWELFFDAAASVLPEVPMLAAHGNHEVNAVHYYSQLAMPGDEQNFAFDYGNVHLTVVNTDPRNVGELEGSIADFLDDDLGASDARWKLVTMHRSLYSSGTRHGSDTQLAAAWGPIFDAHAVDMVVSGHDHIFERTKPIRADVPGVDFTDGTVYMVQGGAGADLYNVEDPLPEFSLLAESTYSATFVSVRRDMLTTETVAQDGSPIDAFTITKSPP